MVTGIKEDQNDGPLYFVWKGKTMNELKSYDVKSGFMGLVNGEYMLFETEGAYEEYMKGEEDG